MLVSLQHSTNTCSILIISKTPSLSSVYVAEQSGLRLFWSPTTVNKWAAAWQNLQKWLCQISLGFRPVCSESSLCAQWVAKDPSFLHADSEDSDQTGRMPRLIWVFAGRTCHFCWFYHEAAQVFSWLTIFFLGCSSSVAIRTQRT